MNNIQIKKKTMNFTMRVDDDMHNKLTELATQMRVSRSECVRKLVRMQLVMKHEINKEVK